MLLSVSGCDKGVRCADSAKIIYYGAQPECEFLILANGELLDAENLMEYENQLTYQDTQSVSIEYYKTQELSNCNALDRIIVACLSN